MSKLIQLTRKKLLEDAHLHKRPRKAFFVEFLVEFLVEFSSIHVFKDEIGIILHHF